MADAFFASLRDQAPYNAKASFHFHLLRKGIKERANFPEKGWTLEIVRKKGGKRLPRGIPDGKNGDYETRKERKERI